MGKPEKPAVTISEQEAIKRQIEDLEEEKKKREMRLVQLAIMAAEIKKAEDERLRNIFSDSKIIKGAEGTTVKSLEYKALKENFTRNLRQLDAILTTMDDLDKAYKFDTVEAKKLQEDAGLSDREAGIILYATGNNKKKAVDAISEFKDGIADNLAEIINSGLQDNIRKFKAAYQMEDCAKWAEYTREMIRIIEDKPEIAEKIKLPKETLNEAYGVMSIGFAITRGLEAVAILEQYAISGEAIPEDLKEDCMKDVLAMNAVNTVRSENPRALEILGRAGFKAKDITMGIVPEAYIDMIDKIVLSYQSGRQLDLKKVSKEAFKEHLDAKKEARAEKKANAISEAGVIRNHDNEPPVLKDDALIKEIEQLHIDVPFMSL